VSLADEILSEAERIRRDGSLPLGFEERLSAAFSEIASDPRALEAEVAQRAGQPGARSGSLPSSGPGVLVHPFARAGRRIVARAARRARRLAGPALRVAERRSIEATSHALDAGSAAVQVLVDCARRHLAASWPGRNLGRISAGAPGARPSLPRALRADVAGHLGDEGIDQMIEERVVSSPVLHAESGDGRLVERLRAAGLVVEGADPYGTGTRRRGALETLARRPACSLGGIVLSGVTDRMTPPRARALARLAASRLAPGGVVVVLSTAPSSAEKADPVAADLGPGRPLHPVTWSHLLTKAGLEQLSVRTSTDGAAYAVAARAPERS
jgi:hypothetical protein